MVEQGHWWRESGGTVDAITPYHVSLCILLRAYLDPLSSMEVRLASSPLLRQFLRSSCSCCYKCRSHSTALVQLMLSAGQTGGWAAWHGLLTAQVHSARRQPAAALPVGATCAAAGAAPPWWSQLAEPLSLRWHNLNQVAGAALPGTTHKVQHKRQAIVQTIQLTGSCSLYHTHPFNLDLCSHIQWRTCWQARARWGVGVLADQLRAGPAQTTCSRWLPGWAASVELRTRVSCQPQTSDP